MPWTREEKYFASHICRQNHLKLCKQNFAGSLIFTIIPRNLGTQISSNKVSKQSQQEGRKSQLTARYPNNLDAVWDSVWRSQKKSPRRRWKEFGLLGASLQRILKKNLQLYPYRIKIKHKLTAADMKFLVSVINHYHINGLHLLWDSLYEKEMFWQKQKKKRENGKDKREKERRKRKKTIFKKERQTKRQKYKIQLSVSVCYDHQMRTKAFP